MMLIAIVATILAGRSEPHVVTVLEGADFARMGIVADIVVRPAGTSNENFAQQLIDAEGLRPWNDQQLNIAAPQGGMATRAVFSGDGREIIVKFVSGDVSRSGRVCRLRLARGGMSSARWNADRWCASSFGLTLPLVPPSPISRVPKRP